MAGFFMSVRACRELTYLRNRHLDKLDVTVLFPCHSGCSEAEYWNL